MCVRCVLILVSTIPERLPPFSATADEERVFLISEELEFRIGEYEGEPTFVWRDIDGDINEFYEFVASGTNAPTRAFFETCMYRAMYERKYRQNADNTTDEELSQFIWRYVIPNPISLLFTSNHLSLGPLSRKERAKALKWPLPLLKSKASPLRLFPPSHLHPLKPLQLPRSPQ